MRILNDIIGKEVLDENANIIGKVKDLEINNASSSIEFLILNKETKSGFGNLKTTNSESKIPYEMVSKIGDKIVLKQSSEDVSLFIKDILMD